MDSRDATNCMHAPIKRAGLRREMFQNAEAERRAERNRIEGLI